MIRTIFSASFLLLLYFFSINAYALNVQVSLGDDGYNYRNKVWRCEASNRSGNSWYAIASSRNQARYSVMRLCERSSYRWNSCYLDGCREVQQQRRAGRYQCNVANSNGQAWYGTGRSVSAARNNALSYCRSNSRYPRSCHVMSCFNR